MECFTQISVVGVIVKKRGQSVVYQKENGESTTKFVIRTKAAKSDRWDRYSVTAKGNTADNLKELDLREGFTVLVCGTVEQASYEEPELGEVIRYFCIDAAFVQILSSSNTPRQVSNLPARSDGSISGRPSAPHSGHNRVLPASDEELPYPVASHEQRI